MTVWRDRDKYATASANTLPGLGWGLALPHLSAQDGVGRTARIARPAALNVVPFGFAVGFDLSAQDGVARGGGTGSWRGVLLAPVPILRALRGGPERVVQPNSILAARSAGPGRLGVTRNRCCNGCEGTGVGSRVVWAARKLIQTNRARVWRVLCGGAQLNREHALQPRSCRRGFEPWRYTRSKVKVRSPMAYIGWSGATKLRSPLF